MPSIAITAFGSFFLPLSLFVLLFRRGALVALLCIAVVLQGPAVLTLGTADARHGVTPFAVIAFVLCVAAAWHAWSHRGLRPALAPDASTPVRVWSVFFAVSIAGALLLPWLFAGQLVIPPLQKSGAHGSMQALVPGLSNVAQALNTVLLGGVLAWLLQQHNDPALPGRMLKGVFVALLVSALIGLQQRLGWNGLLPLWRDVWESNPTYAQNMRSMAGPVPRVGWPLVEASYAGAWFAAVLGGCIAMFLADIRRHLALAGAMVAGFALANTLGATGVLAAGGAMVLALLVILVALLRMRAGRGALVYRLVLALLVCACLGLATYLVLRHEGLLGLTHEAIGHVLHGRSRTVLGDLRPHADIAAVGLLRDTWGVGVGLGSNRASSYLATLASNGGIVGLLLFCAAATLQVLALVRRARRHPDAATLFFLGSNVTVLLAVAIAIPDQNWPVLWLLLFGGLACLARDDAKARSGGETPQPARHRPPHDGPVGPDIHQREAHRETHQRRGVVPEHDGRQQG